MDPVSLKHSGASTTNVSELYRARPRNGGSLESAAIQDDRAAKTSRTAALASNTDAQQAIRVTLANDREFLPYGPDGRLGSGKRLSATPTVTNDVSIGNANGKTAVNTAEAPPGMFVDSDGSETIQPGFAVSQSVDSTTNGQGTTASRRTSATEDAIIGVIARISRSAYSDPVVAGSSETSSLRAITPQSIDQGLSSTPTETQGTNSSPPHDITPSMITGFGSAKLISFYA